MGSELGSGRPQHQQLAKGISRDLLGEGWAPAPQARSTKGLSNYCHNYSPGAKQRLTRAGSSLPVCWITTGMMMTLEVTVIIIHPAVKTS